MEYLSKDVDEALLDVWSRMLLDPPQAVVNCLREAVENKFGLPPSPRDLRTFIRNFQKKCHDPSFIKRLPHRILNEDDDIDVETIPRTKDYRDTLPDEFILDGQRYYLTSIEERHWNHLVLKVCELIAQQNPQDFPIVLNKVFGRNRRYFCNEHDKNENHSLIANTNIYVDTHLSANNAKNLCDGLCRLFGYDFPMHVEVSNKERTSCLM